jgi:capsular polysaccharide transport system permease protein
LSNLVISPLRVQIRVIWALILKEVRILHRRKALGYIWAIIEPMVQILGWLVFITIFRQRIPIGNSAITFLATGILPIMIFMRISQGMTMALLQNRLLINFPIIRANDSIVARFILEAATAVLVIVIIFSVLIVTGLSDPPHDILRGLEAISLIIMISFGFGIFCAYVTLISAVLGQLLKALNRVIYFLSGIFFVPDMLPQNLRNIIWYNPLAHGVELFRSAYYPSFESRMPVPSYMIACAACLTLLGLMLSSILRKRSRYS